MLNHSKHSIIVVVMLTIQINASVKGEIITLKHDFIKVFLWVDTNYNIQEVFIFLLIWLSTIKKPITF